MKPRISWFMAPIFGASLVSAVPSHAAVITGFDIPQSPPNNGFTSISPIAGALGVTATPLTMVGITPNSFGNHFYARDWDSFFNPNKYYETQLSFFDPVILGDLTYSIEDVNGSGIASFQMRSSLDGYASVIDSFLLTSLSGLVVDRTTDLSGLGVLSSPVAFRFYGTTPTTNASLGFANHLPGGAGGGLSDVGSNIRFNGELAPIAAVPEPAVLSLMGLGLLGFGYQQKRQKGRAVG